MPKLKQPAPLQKMALEVLHKFVLQYCNQLSDKRSSDELREGVSIIKEHVCRYIPWQLSADFVSRFLDEFYSGKHPASHLKAASEILMDMKIVGLRCGGPIIGYLDPENVHRLQGLEELDLDYFPTTVSLSLDNFRLNDLTTFISAERCTNFDLTVIGRNCPKLQVLKVQRPEVTDEGLRALSQCSELRVLDISGCAVSHSGINDLLSKHNKIEEFTLWDRTEDSGDCDLLSHLNSSVCSSINHLIYIDDRKLGQDYDDWDHYRDLNPNLRSKDLQVIVTKFPNLTYLAIIGTVPEDLSTLKSLNKLVGLEIYFGCEMYLDEIEQMWSRLKVLLTFIGAKITTLKISSWAQGYCWYQDEVNFIFDSCPNIEHLDFGMGDDLVVIPSFEKLKELYPRIRIAFERIEILNDPALEFSKLPNLETLSIINYGMNLQAIESIMLDDAKFPNLSVLKTNCMKDEELAHIERTARTKNLDFKIENDPKSNWYIEYRFGDARDTDDDADDAK